MEPLPPSPTSPTSPPPSRYKLTRDGSRHQHNRRSFPPLHPSPSGSWLSRTSAGSDASSVTSSLPSSSAGSLPSVDPPASPRRRHLSVEEYTRRYITSSCNPVMSVSVAPGFGLGSHSSAGAGHRDAATQTRTLLSIETAVSPSPSPNPSPTRYRHRRSLSVDLTAAHYLTRDLRQLQQQQQQQPQQLQQPPQTKSSTSTEDWQSAGVKPHELEDSAQKGTRTNKPALKRMRRFSADLLLVTASSTENFARTHTRSRTQIVKFVDTPTIYRYEPLDRPDSPPQRDPRQPRFTEKFDVLAIPPSNRANAHTQKASGKHHDHRGHAIAGKAKLLEPSSAIPGSVKQKGHRVVKSAIDTLWPGHLPVVGEGADRDKHADGEADGEFREVQERLQGLLRVV